MAHQCQIEDKVEPYFPRLPPYASWFTKLRRHYKRMIIVNPQNVMAKRFFPSQAQINREQAKQIELYYTIHPFSDFCFIRQVVQSIIWLFVWIVDPYIIAFDNPIYHYDVGNFMIFKLVIDIILLLDTLLNFLIGYYAVETKEVIMSPKEICINYLKTFFVCELLGNTAFMIIYTFPLPIRYGAFFSVFPLLRYFRFITIYQYDKNFFTVCKFPKSVVTVFSIISFTFFSLHLWACVLTFSPTIHYLFLDESVVEDYEVLPKINRPLFGYMRNFFTVLCHFFGCGVGHFKIRDYAEMTILSLVLIAGYIHYIVIVAILIQYFGSVFISENKYDKNLNHLLAYMNSKKLPEHIRQRLLLFYERRYRNQKVFAEKEMSRNLRKEIVLNYYRDMISNVEILRGMPEDILEKVISHMQCQIYLKDDVIYTSEDPTNSIYMISYGTVLVMLGTMEVIHLEDGNYFGGLILSWKQRTGLKTLSYVALETCEIFTIDRKTLNKYIKTVPEVVKYMDYADQKRMEILERGGKARFITTT